MITPVECMIWDERPLALRSPDSCTTLSSRIVVPGWPLRADPEKKSWDSTAVEIPVQCLQTVLGFDQLRIIGKVVTHRPSFFLMDKRFQTCHPPWILWFWGAVGVQSSDLMDRRWINECWNPSTMGRLAWHKHKPHPRWIYIIRMFQTAGEHKQKPLHEWKKNRNFKERDKCVQ